MKVILTENVEGLGTIGDLVKVKPGFARNFLVPQKMAVEANPRNVKEFEHQKRQLERKLQRLTQEAELFKGRIEKLTCEFSHRAGEEGKLFGSVTTMVLKSTGRRSSSTSLSSIWAISRCRSNCRLA